MILCDTNILIDLYKGADGIVREIEKIGEQNICISAVTAAELIYGAFNKNELQRILTDIDHLQVHHINESISELHLQLLTTYGLSHRLSLPDALIAATALHHNLPLWTLNVKDFRFIPRLQLYSYDTVK